jgi:hypothetical protein
MPSHVSKTTFDGPCVLARGDGQYVKFKEGTNLASGMEVSFTQTGVVLVKPDGPVLPEACDPWNCPEFFDRCEKNGLRLSGSEPLESLTPSTSVISHPPDSTSGSPTASSSLPFALSRLLPKWAGGSSFFVQASNINNDSSLGRSAQHFKVDPGSDFDHELD